MKYKKLKLSAVLFLSLGLTGVQAQEAIPATGGNAAGSGGSANYSVGQVAYQTHIGTNGSMAEGVQQPYEISVATGIEEVEGITLSVSVYPNPTSDFLLLEVDASTALSIQSSTALGIQSSTSLSIQSMSYQLFDMSGKLIENKKLEGTQTRIAMGYLLPATYYVKVIQGNKEVKTFKIIKTQ